MKNSEKKCTGEKPEVSEMNKKIMQFRFRLKEAMVTAKYNWQKERLEEIEKVFKATDHYLKEIGKGNMWPEVVEDLIEQARKQLGIKR